jgi:hypothetical protein
MSAWLSKHRSSNQSLVWGLQLLWVLICIVIWGIAWFITFSFIGPFVGTGALLGQLSVGLLLAVAFGATMLSGIQGLVLHRLIQRRVWWIVGSTFISILGCIAGFLFGGIVTVVLALIVPSGARYAFSIGTALGGGVAGASVAMIQGFAFRPGVQHIRTWVIAWSIGAALGILISLGLPAPDFAQSPFRGFLGGGVYGIATTPVLVRLWHSSLAILPRDN